MKTSGVGLLDRNDLLRANSQISQYDAVEPVNRREMNGLIPEELHYLQLCDDAVHGAIFVCDKELVNATAEDLNGLGEIAIGIQVDQGFFPADWLDFSEGYALALLGLGDDLIVKRDLTLLWLCEADDDQQVGV